MIKLVDLISYIFKVTSEKFDKWYIYLWTEKHLRNFIEIAKNKATTMGHIKRENLSQAKVLIPDEKSIKIMNKIMNPLFEKIIMNNKEIQDLTVTRDTLLPKLMNGEIEV